MMPITQAARIVAKRTTLRTPIRFASTPATTKPSELQRMDPNNYSIPLRPPTMDDLMEPHGLYKDAYHRCKQVGNRWLFAGFVSVFLTANLFYHSGVMDGCFMPNLDNLMEDTYPTEYEKEGRVTV